jgi:hypothetical protein
MFLLLFLLDDRRIRIRTSYYWILIKIRNTDKLFLIVENVLFFINETSKIFSPFFHLICICNLMNKLILFLNFFVSQKCYV